MLPKFRRAFELLRQGNLDVMSRHGLVHTQSFHFPFWPRLQIVGVHKILSRTPRARRSGFVVGGGLRRRLELRDWRHAVGQARQLAEKMRELRIGLLRNDAVAVYEVFGLVVIKARIGPEKFGEIVEAA